jgi:hypothetical protein
VESEVVRIISIEGQRGWLHVSSWRPEFGNLASVHI